VQVTDLWIGDASDSPLETADDVRRAVTLVISIGLVFGAVGSMVLLRWNWITLR
jgi:hypothetical protein